MVTSTPPEMWQLLDAANYLRENGYLVEVVTFCARETTPGNIMISARRI